MPQYPHPINMETQLTEQQKRQEQFQKDALPLAIELTLQSTINKKTKETLKQIIDIMLQLDDTQTEIKENAQPHNQTSQFAIETSLHQLDKKTAVQGTIGRTHDILQAKTILTVVLEETKKVIGPISQKISKVAQIHPNKKWGIFEKAGGKNMINMQTNFGEENIEIFETRLEEIRDKLQEALNIQEATA